MIGCVNLPETTAEKVEESPTPTLDIDATVMAMFEASNSKDTAVDIESTIDARVQSQVSELQGTIEHLIATSIAPWPTATRTPPTSTPRRYSRTPTPWYSDEIFTPKPPKKRTPTPIPTTPTPTPAPTAVPSLTIGSGVLGPENEVIVTVTSLSQTKGVITTVSLSYKLKNNTLDKIIDEGSFRLYLNDGTSNPQYGFFNNLIPGQQITRSYTWNLDGGKYGVRVAYRGWSNLNRDAEHLSWDIP